MGLAISAAAFYIFTSIFALEVLKASRWKVVTLAFAATILLMAGNGLGESPWAAAAFPFFVGGVAALALRFWLKTTWPQSLKIAGSYVGANVALAIVMILLLGPPKP